MNYSTQALELLLLAITEYLASNPPESPQLEKLRDAYLTVSSASTVTGTDERDG